MGFNVAFLSSIVGILKIAEIVFSLLTWAIASGSKYYLHLGLGYVVFTGLVAFVVAIIFLFLYLVEAYPQFFVDARIEGIVSVFVAVINFIAGVVAASQASRRHYDFILGEGWVGQYGYNESCAASFFAFVVTVLFMIDAFLYFVMPTTGRPTSTVTTTTSSSGNNPDPNATGDPNVPPQYTTANY